MEQPSNIQQKVPVSIQDELRTSYLDYAMSVIIGRAIPDVRDGLKPVHRRILFSMNEQKIGPSGAHKKCARVVGDVLGKYHPHGDLAVYDALVRMAQPFSLRYPLIDGQGNFGSVDGDSPAAMRYTESRLSRVAVELLADLEKDTVDFTPNYDDSELEPTVLPAKYPQLLVNGSGGIAVGMATNIPPHNLGEIIDATIAIIRNPDVPVEDLLHLVPGPDFPTGGLIYGRSGIEQAYRTGRGSIVMRGRSTVEKTMKGDREQIVVTEIPYQVNKARLVAKIAECMKDKRIEGIAEVRDESDREGMRIVVELKKDIFPQVILNQLFRLTDLQATFGVINLSIANGRPAVLPLKETLVHFIDHRREVVTRRSRYELRQAEAQRELVEGLGMATGDIERIIATIRASSDSDEAKKRLQQLPLRGLGEFLRRAGRPEAECAEAEARGEYFFSERQAKAILEMRLSRLTGLEREKLAKEYGELSVEIERLRAILASLGLLMNVIVMELEDIKARFGDKRRTEIVPAEAEINVEDLIQEEDMVVTISHAGYVKRTPVNTYRAQRRGGKGMVGMEAREEDWVSQLFVASTHSYVFFFSDKGKVYVKKVYEIPLAARNAKGRAIVNFVGMEPGEKIAAITPVPGFEEGPFVVTLTRRGQIKKTALSEYENYRDKGIIGVRIEEADQLLSAAITDGTRELVIGTKSGMSIRFSEEEVRPTGRATMGVKGIELEEGDITVGLCVSGDGRDRVLAVCERGYGKQTPLDDFRKQSRGGKGVILIDASERNGPVVGVAMVAPSDEVMLVTDRGQTLRTKVSEIRETGRNAQGVRLMNVEEGERVVAIEAFEEADSDEGSGNAPSVPARELERRELTSGAPMLSSAGATFLEITETVGGMGVLAGRISARAATLRFDHEELLRNVHKMGVRSVPIVIVTALFTGAIMVVQAATLVERLGAHGLLGWGAGFGTLREIAPLLTALMINGRVGANNTAELGTMVVTEQIDALRVLAIDPISFLIAPRFLAMVVTLFLSTIFADGLALIGAAYAGWGLLGVEPMAFYNSLTSGLLTFGDVANGLLKSAVFGIVMGLASCHYGLTVKGGAPGVGRAVNATVVASAAGIFILDFFVSFAMD